jgi:hypothetical protein
MAVKIIRKKKKSGVHAKKLPSGVGSSSIVRNKEGVPQATPPRNKSLIGRNEPPPTEGKPHLEKEKTKSQVEILLLKGVITPNQIAVTLGLTHGTAKKYIEEVQYRWAVLGGAPRMRQMRGESRARLDLLTNELWAQHSNSKNEVIKMQALGQLIAVHDRRMQLDGLTPKMLHVLVTQTPDDERSGLGVEDRMKGHQELVRLANALSSYVGEEIEEGEFTEVVNAT